ncbi:hypothetical protein LO772_05975 [Yinghuangia sp. ASG 101]|uniref:hypothetical protein n=1 Tax=Yinghuangia sp. ASG 101 TaxID=2896848 RepID=UPI001E3F1205|nr:hypothetical protein [Yinghuangia sp. ASG 101]UGQ13161.1 hypothetical protein LO772_05975 [Yinghuangia sp. ASG 101]
MTHSDPAPSADRDPAEQPSPSTELAPTVTDAAELARRFDLEFAVVVRHIDELAERTARRFVELSQRTAELFAHFDAQRNYWAGSVRMPPRPTSPPPIPPRPAVPPGAPPRAALSPPRA